MTVPMTSPLPMAAGHFIDLQGGMSSVQTSWPIEPFGHHWGLQCRSCQKPFQRSTVQTGYAARHHTQCATAGCGGPAAGSLRITQSSGDLAQHPSLVAATTWWHSSSSVLTTNDLTGDLIHLGSRDAALHRMLTTGATRRDNERHLHQATVHHVVTVRPEVMIEPEGQIDDYVESHPPGPGEALRYVNRHEAPGDVSLVIPSGCIAQITHVSTHTFAQDGTPPGKVYFA